MFLNFLVFALVGKLLMFLWNKSPYSKWIAKRSKFFEELFACGLCLGTWTYFLLDFLFQINLLEIGPPVIIEFLDACITTFIVYVFSAGWNTLFRNIMLSGVGED